MSLGRRLSEWLGELRQPSPQNLSRRQRAIRYTMQLVRHGIAELKRDRAAQMAAALTYHTLFSMLPTIALALVVLQGFVGPVEREEFKDAVVEWVLKPLRPSPTEPGDDLLEVAEGREEFEKARQLFEQRVEGGIDSLEGIDFKSIGVVGVLLFIYAALGLLGTVERSFTTVYGVRRVRPWHRRIPLYYSVVTLGPLVALAGLWLRSQFIDLLESGAWTHWLAGPLVFLSPLLTGWLLLFVFFTWIPDTRVSMRASAVGALVSAVLVGLTIELLGLYVRNAALATLYGALALLPLFLFWIFVAWLILLFGLEVAYTLQTYGGRDLASLDAKSTEVPFFDPGWILPVATRIGTAFEAGELCSSEQIAADTGLPRPAIAQLVSALEGSGVVRHVNSDGSAGYTLARPASRITLAEILRVAQGIVPKQIDTARRDGGWTALERLREMTLASVAEQTLLEAVVSSTGASEESADEA